MIDIQAKKDWIDWLISSIKFQTREVAWILDYIKNHELILKNCVFVEHAKEAPRGLVIAPREEDGPSMILHIEGHSFTNADQIFHEIRLNWKKPFYIEIKMKKCWDCAFYLAVLEDNPFWKWNDTIDETIYEKIDLYIEDQKIQEEIEGLLRQIDSSLDKNDRESFEHLSAKLVALNNKKSK